MIFIKVWLLHTHILLSADSAPALVAFSFHMNTIAARPCTIAVWFMKNAALARLAAVLETETGHFPERVAVKASRPSF